MKVFLSVLILCISQLVNAAVSATIDRDSAVVNESLELTVTSDHQARAPDWSVLKRDFELLGVSQGVFVRMVNGVSTTQKRWRISLIPRATGSVEIPSFKVGSETTNPIRITIKKQTVTKGIEKDVFFESTLSNKNPIVQQKLIYTLKLYTRYPFIASRLREPKINGHAMQLIKQNDRAVVKNNKEYRLFEARYLIVPEKSGQLNIPAPQFQGAISAGTQRSVKRIFIKGKPYHLKVQAKPSSFKGKWWLPAKNLSLSQTWSKDPSQIKAGEAITRTIVLEAQGVTKEQLPDINLTDIDGMNIYPDKPETSTRLNEDKLVASKIAKFAMVPTSSGDIHIPKFTLTWWDTQARKARTEALPAVDIHVLAPKPVAVPIQSVQEIPDHTWVILLPLMLTGWIFAAWMWVRSRRPALALEENMSLRHAMKLLKSACGQNNLEHTCETLAHIGSLVWPDAKILNANDVAKQLNDTEFSQMVDGLNHARYSATPNLNWDGSHFYKIFSSLLTKRAKKGTEKSSDGLPPLYPQHNT